MLSGGIWLRIAAIAGALGVAAGAFGAHGLKRTIEPRMLEAFETGVRYHLVHTLAIAIVGVWLLSASSRPGAPAQAAAWGFLAGIVLFSGSLYAWALSGPRWLVFITPIGGLAFLAGWIALALAAKG